MQVAADLGPGLGSNPDLQQLVTLSLPLPPWPQFLLPYPTQLPEEGLPQPAKSPAVGGGGEKRVFR